MKQKSNQSFKPAKSSFFFKGSKKVKQQFGPSDTITNTSTVSTTIITSTTTSSTF